MATGPVLSVVDYAAWENGYMPPSEHILIDKLSYRGARVVMSMSLGDKQQLWIVLEDKSSLTNRQRKLMRELIAMWFEDEDEVGPTGGSNQPGASPPTEGEAKPLDDAAPTSTK